MDLVDIDQMLDNLETLELHEEAAKEEKRLQAESKLKDLQQKSTNGIVQLPPTPDGKVDFNAVSQVFNSLESLEAKGETAIVPTHSRDRDDTDHRRFHPEKTSNLVNSSKQELKEYEHEAEQSKDIYKYTEERSKRKIIHDSEENYSADSNASISSESLTTSSPSTFSSGPSLDVEVEETEQENERIKNIDEEREHLLDPDHSEDLPSNSIKSEIAPEPETDQATEIKFEVATQSQQLAEHQDFHSKNVDDLAHGLSSISITSVNLQSHSILPLAGESMSSSLGKVLDNLTDSQNSTALSQLKESKCEDFSEAPEPPNTSIEVINEHQQQPQQQQRALDQKFAFEYPQQKFESCSNRQVQQPITFCSTMDDISDTELDSLLQEMDIDEEVDEPKQLPTQEVLQENIMEKINEDVPVKPTAEAVRQDLKEIEMDPKEDMSSVSSSGDHPNGDSFSQASTVELSEIRQQTVNPEDMPVQIDDNIIVGEDNVASSYSSTGSSSLEGDIIQQKNEMDDNDLNRPQRPTSLDLPALQNLERYANAGQTPPGNESQQPEQEQESRSPPLEADHEIEHPLQNDVAEATGYSEDPNANLGKIPPIWVPDNMAMGCMQCSAKFNLIKRRHHCRACGQVLCSVCCSQKFNLEFLTEPDSRVCVQCYLILTQRQSRTTAASFNPSALNNAATVNATATAKSPNPNNPMEYCTTIPPHRQVSGEPKTPSVIVPVGVLKKDNGSNSSNSSNSSQGQKARKRKSVMFSDGIAPGSDLASIDQWNEQPKQPRRQKQSSGVQNKPPTPARSDYMTDATTMGLMASLFRGSIPPSVAAATLNAVQSGGSTAAKSTVPKAPSATNTNTISVNSSPKTTKPPERSKNVPPSGCDEQGCFIPKEEGALPPIVITKDESGCDLNCEYKDVMNNFELVKRLQNETLKFAVQKNFFIFVKIVHLKCCLNRTVLNFTTHGMHHVGNDEIVILLEFEIPESKETANSHLLPKDVFVHLNEIYNNAEHGTPTQELSHTSPENSNFLGSTNFGGFIYLRPTFQCMQDIILPENPYLIGILIHRHEIPWAKVFPLRLMLRLGAAYRYYPCPHVSIMRRESVYAEIAQTIISFLADFRNYTYTLPFIRGLYIHMEDRQTTLLIPKNRLEDVIKAVNNSSDHILAFGGNFSKTADGHLVCMQNVSDDKTEMYAYSTQAINIQGQPRKVTGASFFVLNESLKASSGLSGKCSIVEDGLMVQILPSKMEEVRNSLKNQEDVTITCGPVNADEQHTEIVCLKWVENDKEFNINVKSPIDERVMDGISSMRVHASFIYSNSNYAIRLTDIYILQYDAWYNYNSATLNSATTKEITGITEQIARSTSMALVPFLDLLAASKSLKIGLRATLHQDNVCYEAGARGSKLPPLYMNALDDHLIPTLHSISANIEEAIILELIFYILNV